MKTHTHLKMHAFITSNFHIGILVVVEKRAVIEHQTHVRVVVAKEIIAKDVIIREILR